MVNEDRVKQLYKLAVYEKNEEKLHREAGQFYKIDYVMKEVLKSFLSGTIAYVIMAILWMISNWDLVMYQINTLEIVDTAVVMAVIYVVFIIVYLIITVLVYLRRYKTSKKKLDAYIVDLKKAYSMFDREEKLKN